MGQVEGDRRREEGGGRREFRDMYLDPESRENNILRWSNIT